MLSGFVNAFKIKELRDRIVFTALIIVVSRIGAAIPVPGVDAGALQRYFEQMETSHGGSLLALMNIFSGGALEHMAIFSLTIMPYISASIIMQLMTAVVPQLAKLSREQDGRQKITQYTRYFTLAIAVFQSLMYARTFEHPQNLPMFSGLRENLVSHPGLQFEITTVITLTCGTMFLMWLGEQVTERGIGNGISMLIATNILAKFPAAVGGSIRFFIPPEGSGLKANPALGLLFVGMFFLVIAAVIVVTQMQRKIPVLYAQRMVGRKMFAGGQNFMPLKVNYSGVMPIIFAQAILMFPATIFSFVQVRWLNRIAQSLSEGGWVHLGAYAIMIFFFSYFWVATVFNPIQIADDLKKNGGYIPGVRPGKPTAEFLDFTMTRITFAGAIFLTGVAVFPIIMNSQLKIEYLVASFFGGTSLLIIVGVLLDTLRQVETHLINRNYEGFLKKGRLKGRI